MMKNRLRVTVVIMLCGAGLTNCMSGGSSEAGDSPSLGSNSEALTVLPLCLSPSPGPGFSFFAGDNCSGTEYGTPYKIEGNPATYYEDWDEKGCVSNQDTMVATRSWRDANGTCRNNGTISGGTSGTQYALGGPVNRDYCEGTVGDWIGCHENGCSVCSELVTNYPLYYAHHPHCVSNDSCGSGPTGFCNASCPAPSVADECNGTPGEWAGCRENGCEVCSNLVVDYPYYWSHHPSCAVNENCGSVTGYHGTCNALCPAPTAADKKP
jgi:hypothetical protein